MNTPTPSNPATEAPLQADSFAKLIAQLRNGSVSPANRADDHDLADRIERLASPPPQEAPAPVRADELAMRWAFFGWQHASWDWELVAGAVVEADADWRVLPEAPKENNRRVASGEDSLAVVERVIAMWHEKHPQADAIDINWLRSAGVVLLPSRAQAASAGEPVAWRLASVGGKAKFPWHDISVAQPNDNDIAKGWHVEYAYAAPTDGRSTNDVVAAYREPDGWQLVPKEPTDEMARAMHEDQWNAEPDGEYHGEPTTSATAIWKQAYRAALAKAPVHAVIRIPAGES